MRRMMLGIVAVLAALGWTVSAQASVLAEFKGSLDYELEVGGFRLPSKQKVTVEATSYAYRTGGQHHALTNVWILDAATREVAWDLFEERSDWKEDRIHTDTYSVELPAGEYEVYYSTYPQHRERRWKVSGLNISGFWKGVDDIYEDLLDAEKLDSIDDLYRRFSASVDGNGTRLSESDVQARQDRTADDAIVSIRHVGNHDQETAGFELPRKTRLHLYTVGEAREDGAYDYGVVMNADTHEKVWSFDYRESRHAGGAEKNRVIDAKFDAPAGRYVVMYTTDGSHAYGRWNSAPPYDPEFWGITVSAADGDVAGIKMFDYKPDAMKNVIASHLKVGDDENLRSGFSLGEDTSVRVYAIGEGTGGEMYDYGWIVDADSRQRVWEMRYRDTEPAGGAEKNRVEDEVIELPAGNYLLYYASDDSHSYAAWNAAPPLDRDNWGITVMGAKGYNPKKVSEYSYKDDTDYLARIVGVGDDEYLSSDFTLTRETDVQVLAVGEGVDGRMYDYGWIEDENGRVVWEMTYRRTEHAGGAQKNRMFSGTVKLGPGKYRAYYETDGSHSARSWNSRRPDEPELWGITLRAK